MPNCLCPTHCSHSNTIPESRSYRDATSIHSVNSMPYKYITGNLMTNLMSRLFAYAGKHPVCCTRHTAHTYTSGRAAMVPDCVPGHISQHLPVATYGGMTIKLGGRSPHGECFLALGFELQPVELCSPHCCELQRLCSAHPNRALLTPAGF